MLTKSVQIKLDDGFKADWTERIIEGYASVFGVLDSYGDDIAPGAFGDTIKDRFQARLAVGLPSRVKVLWQHSPQMPIGLPIEMAEDGRGLKVKAKISKVPEGDKALQLIADGVIDSFSIGFDIEKSRIDESREIKLWDGMVRKVRIIEKIKLFEFSPVTFPANEQADIQSIRDSGLEIEMPPADPTAAHLRAGRVLSARSRKALSAALECMRAASVAVDELLQSADADETQPAADVPLNAAPASDPAVMSLAASLSHTASSLLPLTRR